MLDSETETKLFVSKRDGERIIEKVDVAEQFNSPLGIFAVGDKLTRSEHRDLVEYLETLR